MVPRKLEVDDQQILSPVSWVLTLGADKALSEEQGADEEHQRPGDLAGDEQVPQAAPGNTRLVPTANRRCRIRLRSPERRECSAGDNNDEPAEKRNGQRGDVETNVLHSWECARCVRQQQADQPVGQQNAGDACHDP